MLLERQSELDQVSRALRDAHSGSGSQLLVGGPLGNGKSALLQEIPTLEAAEGFRVIRANASSLEQDFAFGVVRQLFDPVLSRAVPELEERWLTGPAGLARVVFADDAPAAPEAPPVMMQEAALQGLTALLRNISVDKPSLILIDDLQWVDEPSLRWLSRLSKRLDSLRVLLVTAVREGDSRTERPLVTELTSFCQHELRPAPLSVSATADLVSTHTGEWPDEEFVLACHETTDGNPMFLMSVLLNLAYSGVAPAARHVDMVRSLRPAQLRERLIQCLQTQSEPVRSFARATAVLGEHVDVELIGHLAGLDAIGAATAMRTMHQLGLLKSDQQPHFMHLVVQDAIEEWMTAEEREELHLRAVKLLHGSGYPAEQVAAQLMTITSQHDWWAIEVLRSAADTAMRRGAPEVAARYLRRALLDASPDGEDRARLLVDLATAERGFDASASVRHISYAVPLLRTVRDRAAAVVRIAPTVLVGASRPVRDLLERVADELGDPVMLAGVDRELAFRLEARLRYSWHSDPAQLGDSVRRLLALGDQDLVGSGAERELLVVLLDAAMLTAKLPADEVARLGRRVLDHEPATSSHVHTALPLLVTSMAAADSLDDLAPWLDLALERARLQDVTIEHALIRTEQALVFLHLGRLDEARAAAYDALDLTALDWKGSTATAAVGLAAVALELREPQLISRLLDLNQERTDHACLAAVYRMLHGSAAALSGELDRALEYYLECGRALDRAGWRNPVLFPWRLTAASLNARLGDKDAAMELADEARARAVAWGAPSGVGRALCALGRLTPGPHGLDLLRESVEVLGASGNIFELAKSLLELGTRERADGESSAGDHLRRSQELALRAGANWLVAKSGEELETADAPGVKASLTKSEYKVCCLAVDGHTNQEIADILQVTCRAIEKHLTNSFRKLGIRRRTELPEALAGAHPEAVRPASGRA
ncbi:AAA family ATPase [Lentzea tibetensis]|uniref:AAA family ATPase n=1 Tax=Lentzea tibetensis TaxID=2591470 RepID=A0A563EF58_9PSEU|nr:helix-turn-helix transcriptional regulator [Lentzea tibetensis]TWP44035.1 AAA family ATPase [Lentzea tibetensis]